MPSCYVGDPYYALREDVYQALWNLQVDLELGAVHQGMFEVLGVQILSYHVSQFNEASTCMVQVDGACYNVPIISGLVSIIPMSGIHMLKGGGLIVSDLELDNPTVRTRGRTSYIDFGRVQIFY